MNKNGWPAHCPGEACWPVRTNDRYMTGKLSSRAPRHIVPRQTVPRQKGPRKLSRDRLSRDQKSPRTKCPMNQNVPGTKMSHELNYPKLRFLMSAFWPKPTLQLDLANDDEWPPSRFRCQKCAIGHGTFGLDISRSTWHLPSPARCNVKI